MFAGEICTISAPVMSSMTLRVTEDDAAPMMTETSWLMRSVTDWVATSACSASDESVCSTSTSAPRTPPAALISSTARSTPAISGGPSWASEPVCGSRVPIFSGVALAADSSPPSVAGRLLAAAGARGEDQCDGARQGGRAHCVGGTNHAGYSSAEYCWGADDRTGPGLFRETYLPDVSAM